MLEKEEFLSAEVTGEVGARCPNAMPRVGGGLPGPCGEAWDLPIFLQQGGPVELGSRQCPRSRILANIIISVPLPHSQAGNRSPRHGVSASTGRSILMAEVNVCSFTQPAFTVPGASGLGHAGLLRMDAVFSVSELPS